MTVSIRTHQAWLARGGAAVVLSLQALKDQVPMQWDAICTPTGASLERLFRAKLGPSDRFARIDELNWLVVMPDTTIEDALACCLGIAYQLHNAITPVCKLEQLKVSSVAVVGNDVLELTPLSDEQLRVAAHRAGLDALVTATPEVLAADVPVRAKRFATLKVSGGKVPCWPGDYHNREGPSRRSAIGNRPSV